EVEVPVVADLALRADRHGRLEDQRLALLRLDDLDVGIGERQDVLLDQRLAVRGLDELVDGLVEDGPVAEDGLEDAARRLAGPEAGDAGAAREGAGGLAHGDRQALGGDLDLEDQGALRSGGRGDLHRPRRIAHEGPRTARRPLRRTEGRATARAVRPR